MHDVGWLTAGVRAMEPKFAFEQEFDPQDDSGWCPCKLGGQDCGFECELLEPPESVPTMLAAQCFDLIALLSHRSGHADAVCAVLVAANLAQQSGGVLEAPDGALVDADDALEWASDMLRALKKGGKARKTAPAKKQAEPRQLINAWLDALAGTRALGLMRAMPDDPLIAIRFSTRLVLKTRRWTVAPVGDESLSTRALPRELSATDQVTLDRAVETLSVALQAGPVTAARCESDGLELLIGLAGAELVVHAQAARYASPLEELFKLEAAQTRVHPDTDEARLVAV